VKSFKENYDSIFKNVDIFFCLSHFDL